MSRTSRVNVRLRANSSFALHWLIPRLSRLQLRHPQITPHLVSYDSYINRARRNFDIAVELAQAPPADLHAEFLMEEYLTPVCSRKYLIQHPFLRAPADLAHCTLLHDGRAWRSATEDAEWRYWLDHVGAPRVDSHDGHFFTSCTMAIEAAIAHQGVALGHLSLLDSTFANRALVTPLAQNIMSPLRYYLAYPRDLSNQQVVQQVANWLRDEALESSKAYPQSSGRSVGINVHPYASANVTPIVGSCSALSHSRTASVRAIAT